MTKIVHKQEIQSILEKVDPQTLLKIIEEGFVAYSEKQVVVPPVGELLFQNPPGDAHIKYGYIKEDKYFVIKVATGFYDNPKINLPTNNGLSLVFDQKTGELLSILLDEGHLTQIRTAIAGAIVTKYLAPQKITNIGIVGTGTQAKLQLQYLQYVTDFREVYVWGRNEKNLEQYKRDMENSGFSIITTEQIEDVTTNCNLIVTTTPSAKPILFAEQIRPGTHITAMGTDSAGKQELDAHIFAKADMVIADSKIQCIDRGDISYAVKEKLLDENKIIELGELIKSDLRRKSDDQITVADLTGVAIQDIQIAKVIQEATNSK